VSILSVSYNKLWKLLIDKNMKRTELQATIGFGPNALAHMGKNEHVSMRTLESICKYLKCDIGDIVEVILDDTQKS
jgi:putative transcriptional regulator